MKNRNFILYLSGRFVSFIGTYMQAIVLPLYIFDKTGSGTLMGLITILTWIPHLLCTPFSGIVGDRKNRRNVMMAMDFSRGLLLCGLTFISARGNMTILMLFMVLAAVSSMDEFFGNSSFAIMPELSSEMDFTKAFSIRGATDGIANLIGPLIGGIIYSFFGITAVLFINGISFLISGSLSIFIKYHRKNINRNKLTVKVFIRDNLEALRFLINKKSLLQLTIFATLCNFLNSPVFDIVYPYVIKGKLGFTSRHFGYFAAIMTLGGIAANVCLPKLINRFGMKDVFRIGILAQSLLSIAMFIVSLPAAAAYIGSPDVKMFIIIAFLCLFVGSSFAAIQTVISTNQMKLVPDSLRSRYGSVVTMICTGIIPAGALIFGFMLDHMPYYYLLFIVNAVMFITYIIFIIKADVEAYIPELNEAAV